MLIQPILGLGIFILLSWLISEQRRRFPVKLVIVGLALQLLLAILLFHVQLFQSLFLMLNKLVLALENATARFCRISWAIF
ncbi:Na+ dependent nucleoside transporter N-terminus [Geoalkalibacter ferrihydriticus]|uniref:Concentrative nucleoside transporter N-terminal domain-containing protein n=2 Tax=Geoalkalibacter ferrihydriticus TaxID=392333 RepID=A0A0C2HWP3_9BACT|nr:Na+ dependent nucleoside transporter N-terminal domain-containing protein [Geoalkalibacter ferrihydriticus]KIH77207.1 hypothetical protein GFER_00050 [Geoalkalibacter ferrihydriticus DSM 17813]SDM25346.1 Na+ dependent nucleoside transporter N-terminus [Geoalkalibacter ferrihydriticus]